MNNPRARESEPGRNANQAIPERRYQKPPVIEALCEIYFTDSAWDDTIPGAFYEGVKGDFPEKRQREIQQAEIALGPEEATAGIRRLPPWMQFVSAERHRMIQVARDLLVVNQMYPYPHFEEWEPEVYRALELYRAIARPTGIARLGVRYINRVVIPEERIRMEDYFTVYPNLPQRLGDTHGSFLVRVEIPSGHGHSVIITFGTAPQPPTTQHQHAFTLDFYDILLVNKPIEEVDIRAEVGRAHVNLVMAFEDSILDRLRVLFEQEEG